MKLWKRNLIAAAYHDARIQLDSQLGHGTRVRVLFHPSQEGEGV